MVDYVEFTETEKTKLVNRLLSDMTDNGIIHDYALLDRLDAADGTLDVAIKVNENDEKWKSLSLVGS